MMPSAILLFFSFKQGLVRQDGVHTSDLQLTLALASIPLLVVAKTARDRCLFAFCQAASMLVGLSILYAAFPGFQNTVKNALTLQNVGRSVSAYTHLERTQLSVTAEVMSALSPLKMDARYAEEIGSAPIDVIPWDIARIRANNWNWRPRPVFQSYQAVTPDLDALNASYLRGPSAPKYVLVRWEAIDEHHPFAEDPLTWRALLEHYDVAIHDAATSLLRLRSKKRSETLKFVRSFRGHWDEPISLPDTGRPIVIQADISPSMYGVVRNLLYRTEAVSLEATIAGEKSSWRVVWQNLANGFIAAPLPRNLAEYMCLFRDSRCGQRVTSVTFRAVSRTQFTPVIAGRIYEWILGDLGDTIATATDGQK
jgi:hypothetical protein